MSENFRFPYTVIRYHYDQVRNEGVNVGVIVQTDTGLRTCMIEDWEALRRAYPFIDIRELQNTVEVLKSQLSQPKMRVFDYERSEALDLPTNDKRLLGFLPREINHNVEATEPRYAELADASESQLNTLIGYLYQTLVQPPKPTQQAIAEGIAQSQPRPAHATLHRKATNRILQTAKKLSSQRVFEETPSISGRTREWKFDLKVRPASRILQHILVLPDTEETLHETAALGRIWQDVLSRHPTTHLTAVYYSEEKPSKSELKDGEKLLAKDNITAIYSGELSTYYLELLGQKRLPS
jgi:hypothetical protein